MFNYYQLKFQIIIKTVYNLCLHQYLYSITVSQTKLNVKGGGSHRDYLILLSGGGGWAFLTDDCGGGKNVNKLITSHVKDPGPSTTT